jgi:hypothetical protein
LEEAVRDLPLYIFQSRVGEEVDPRVTFPEAFTTILCCSYCPLFGIVSCIGVVVDSVEDVKFAEGAGNICSDVEVPPTLEGANGLTPELTVSDAMLCS